MNIKNFEMMVSHKIKWIIQYKYKRLFLTEKQYYSDNLEDAKIFNSRNLARKEKANNEKILKLAITKEIID